MSILAVNGGTSVRQRPWPSWPAYTDETISALTEVVRSGRWTISGPWVGSPSIERQFGERFAAFVGTKYCVPMASGSASLVVALESLDLEVGDEVIVPGLTWVATATAVVNTNAVPILVDVNDSYCIDPVALAGAINSRTRAIMVVHLYCSVADMDAILDLAHRRGLSVIEDCAQAHGAEWRGRRVGGIGQIGAFSMQQGKVLTSGEGGALCTDDPDIYRRMQQLRCDGREYLDATPQFGHHDLLDVGDVLGTNYCMSEFQAAILMEHLKRFAEEDATRTANGRYLARELQRVRGVRSVILNEGTTKQSFFKFVLRYEREAFANRRPRSVAAAIEAETGVAFKPIDAPLNDNPLYRPLSKRRYRWAPDAQRRLDPRQFRLPVAERLFEESLVMHHAYLQADRHDLDQLVESLDKVQRNASQIEDD